MVKKQLEELGFVDIETIDINDLKGWQKYVVTVGENDVQSVTIAGKEFKRDSYFKPTDKVIISYH